MIFCDQILVKLSSSWLLSPLLITLLEKHWPPYKTHCLCEMFPVLLLRHLLLPLSQMAALVAQTLKNLLAMQETWVWSLGQEDALEQGNGYHSSILAWRIPRTEEPGYSPWGCKESDMTERLMLLSQIPFPEKAMATHSSTLAWKIPWMEEPGGL